MDVNGRHDKQGYEHCDPHVSTLQDLSNREFSDMAPVHADALTSEVPNHGSLPAVISDKFQRDSTLVNPFRWRPEDVKSSVTQMSSNKECVAEHTVTVTKSSSLSTDRTAVSARTNAAEETQESNSTKSDLVPSSDPICRTSPCAFASTRHQSYGNLGMSSGVAGLSSTSATLAFLPLRASGDPSKPGAHATSLPAVPCVPSLTDRTNHTLAASSSACSYDPAGSSHAKTSLGVSNTAAEIWDRRSSFFSEPPKPVSLPTGHSLPTCLQKSAADQSTLESVGSSLAAGGQSTRSAFTDVRATDKSDAPVFEELCKLSLSCDANLPSRASYSQQPPPPPTPAVQVDPVSPGTLLVEAPTLLSCQRDSSILLSRSRESPEVEWTSMSPPGASPRDGAAGSAPWYRSSPRSFFSQLPASQIDSTFWEAAESGSQSAPLNEGSSGLQHSHQFYDAFMHSIPSSSASALITPPKVGNIQKLKAFFGETTPRIIEAKTDARATNESVTTETSIEMETFVDSRKSVTMESVGVAKSTMITSTVSDRSAMTAKGKKMANWVLASRHHSSHPQLPSTRPKKPMTDREPSLSPKQKEHRTWKGKVVHTFKRHSSSSAVVTSDPPSQPEEITGTFGVPLEFCCPSVMNELVPLLVEVCTQVVEERGLENQGIYRVPGNSIAINTLVEELNRDPESACLDNEKWQDVNSVSSLLKLFFRKLPDSLITDDLYEDVIAANRTENSERRMLKLKKLLHELPEHNFETFRFLAQHLNKVASREELNKMDAHNLAIVFGPSLVRPQDNSMVVMVKDMSDQCRIVESIIVHCDWFFSSWDEDVNVPVDELSGDALPISTMNQQLLAKAESLAAAPFYRDFISSLIRSKPGKKKSRLDKSKSADLDPDRLVGSSRIAARRQAGVSDEFSGMSRPQRAISDDADLAFEIRRYPAYRFEQTDGALAANMTENAKPRILRRTSHSCESLRVRRDRGPGHRPVCNSSVTLPQYYPYASSFSEDHG